MTAEQRLRFATEELDRADRDAETKRLAWLVARVAHPAVLNWDAALEYAEAANLAAEARKVFVEAQIDAQASWVEITRRAEAELPVAGTPAFARRAIAQAPAQRAPQAQPSPGAVARISSRED